MELIAQIIGVVAVVIFLLSYQQKKRKNIILFNVTSRILYILQYVLLGAYAGAVLDVLGSVSSIVAAKKNSGFVKKHTVLVLIIMNLSIIAAGSVIAVLNKSWIDCFSIMGVLLHTSAFWINDEKIIRRVSLIGSPFWLIYNFLSRAYGSAVGDILSICSIIIAMIRHKEKNQSVQCFGSFSFNRVLWNFSELLTVR